MAVLDSRSHQYHVPTGGLKHRWGQPRVGSNPTFGTTNTPPTFTKHARRWLSRMAVLPWDPGDAWRNRTR
jgi:hypothetical protein